MIWLHWKFIAFSILLWSHPYNMLCNWRSYLHLPDTFSRLFLVIYVIFPCSIFLSLLLTTDCNILGENVSSSSGDNGSQSGNFIYILLLCMFLPLNYLTLSLIKYRLQLHFCLNWFLLSWIWVFSCTGSPMKVAHKLRCLSLFQSLCPHIYGQITASPHK